MTNLIGEFLGTMVLVLFGTGVVANCLLEKSKGKDAGWMVITTGWAFAVTLGVFTSVTLGAPQADLNPAVTLAKFYMGIYSSLSHALTTMVVQIAGAILGATLCWLTYLPHWKETKDQGAKQGIFATGPAIRNYGCNFLTEVIGTFFLVFGIFVIFSSQVGSLPAGMGPYLVGILVWALGLSLGGPTGYAINPARDLGPRIAHAILPIAGKGSSDWAYSWIPIAGPFVGATLAYLVGHFLQIM